MNIFRSKQRDSLSAHTDLPKLPEELDDNFYLASASRAGEIDRNSGAYDEFLFSEDGLDKMPFESSVDHHLALAETRLLDKGRRSYLGRQEQLFELRGEIASAEYAVDEIEERISTQVERLQEQSAILEGNKTGRAGLSWKGSIPESTSTLNAGLHIALPKLVFLSVAVVDIAIIILSFNAVPGFKTTDAIIFALPAVGVQLVFPHFIGDRINLLAHGYRRRLLAYLSIVFLATVWLSFVYVLTEVRMFKILTDTADTGEQMNEVTVYALYAGNIIMLVALGTWLLASAAKSNHHQMEYRRVDFSLRKLRKKLEAAKRHLVELEARLPAAEQSLDVIRDSYDSAVSAMKNELAEAAKSVYRRSLINQFGSVDFTGAFLGLDSSATPERLRNKNRIADKPQVLLNPQAEIEPALSEISPEKRIDLEKEGAKNE